MRYQRAPRQKHQEVGTTRAEVKEDGNEIKFLRPADMLNRKENGQTARTPRQKSRHQEEVAARALARQAGHEINGSHPADMLIRSGRESESPNSRGETGHAVKE